MTADHPTSSREPDVVLRHEDQGPWLLLSSPGRMSVHVTMAHLRERLAELGYVVEPAVASAALDVPALAQASTIIGLRLDIAYWRAVAAEYARLIRDRFRPSEPPGPDS